MLKIGLATSVIVMVAIGIYLVFPEEIDRFDWSATDYMVVVRKRRYESYLMRAPGDGGGAPGFVEIFNRKGESFGRIPVPMTSNAREIRWTPTGAEIVGIGEWDFTNRTCFYWSEKDEKIWVRR